jgi:hypothetical protein
MGNAFVARAFEQLEDTQNAVMDGTAKTITFVHAAGDVNSSMNVVVDGSQKVFYTPLKTPTTTNAKPLLPGTDSTIALPAGCTAVKFIGAAGSTVYVTRGRGA